MSMQRVYSMLRSAVILTVLPLTFAAVMPKTAQAASFNYTACNMVNFDTSNGAENSTPSQALINRITPAYFYGASTLCDRPVNDYDDYFVHTFSNLPNNIVSGQLEIRLRANGSSLNSNDSMHLSFTNPDETLDPVRWGRFIGAGEATPGLLPTFWSGGDIQTFTFDLANLPLAPNQTGVASNLIATLNTKGFLDVIVQDDTAVDYIKLSITTDEETKSVPEPTSTLGLFALGSLGIGAIAKRKLNKKNQDDNLN